MLIVGVGGDERQTGFLANDSRDSRLTLYRSQRVTRPRQQTDRPLRPALPCPRHCRASASPWQSPWCMRGGPQPRISVGGKKIVNRDRGSRGHRADAPIDDGTSGRAIRGSRKNRRDVRCFADGRRSGYNIVREVEKGEKGKRNGRGRALGAGDQTQSRPGHWLGARLSCSGGGGKE